MNVAKQYDERLSFLRSEAILEGTPINPESVDGFFEFIQKFRPKVIGGLVLIDNGNLRAVWNQGCESFVGIQFYNRQLAQYVLFSKPSLSLPVAQSFGQASFESVMNQIEALQLKWMLYEQP